MMVPYMKKNHMARGQNFLPLVNVSLRASTVPILAEVDSPMGSPVSSETISSMLGSSFSDGWLRTISQHSPAMTAVISASTMYVVSMPSESIMMTMGVAAAIPPTFPTSSRMPLMEANSFFLNQTARIFIMGM